MGEIITKESLFKNPDKDSPVKHAVVNKSTGKITLVRAGFVYFEDDLGVEFATNAQFVDAYIRPSVERGVVHKGMRYASIQYAVYYRFCDDDKFHMRTGEQIMSILAALIYETIMTEFETDGERILAYMCMEYALRYTFSLLVQYISPRRKALADAQVITLGNIIRGIKMQNFKANRVIELKNTLIEIAVDDDALDKDVRQQLINGIGKFFDVLVNIDLRDGTRDEWIELWRAAGAKLDAGLAPVSEPLIEPIDEKITESNVTLPAILNAEPAKFLPEEELQLTAQCSCEGVFTNADGNDDDDGFCLKQDVTAAPKREAESGGGGGKRVRESKLMNLLAAVNGHTAARVKMLTENTDSKVKKVGKSLARALETGLLHTPTFYDGVLSGVMYYEKVHPIYSYKTLDVNMRAFWGLDDTIANESKTASRMQFHAEACLLYKTSEMQNHAVYLNETYFTLPSEIDTRDTDELDDDDDSE
jgi:hypothetical protein